MRKTYNSEIAAAMHDMAVGLHKAGVMSDEKLREMDELCLVPLKKLTPEEIKGLREETCLTQAVFARFLNVTPGLVSQWERGLKSPSGAALKLLALVQKKGLDAIA